MVNQLVDLLKALSALQVYNILVLTEKYDYFVFLYKQLANFPE
jgi:hypothetical protein